MPDKKPRVFDIDADIRNQDWLKNPSEIAISEIMTKYYEDLAAGKNPPPPDFSEIDKKYPPKQKGKP